MHGIFVAAAAAVATALCDAAAADESRESDGLRPVAECIASKPFHARQTDRLPATNLNVERSIRASFFVEAHSVVATAYVLTPPGQQAAFENVLQYEAAKKSFTDSLVACLQAL